jgi:hypothetical protein
MSATSERTVTIEVVGKRPENEPYLWVGTDDRYLTSLDHREMRRLADQIYRALGLKPK